MNSMKITKSSSEDDIKKFVRAAQKIIKRMGKGTVTVWARDVEGLDGYVNLHWSDGDSECKGQTLATPTGRAYVYSTPYFHGISSDLEQITVTGIESDFVDENDPRQVVEDTIEAVFEYFWSGSTENLREVAERLVKIKTENIKYVED